MIELKRSLMGNWPSGPCSRLEHPTLFMPGADVGGAGTAASDTILNSLRLRGANSAQLSHTYTTTPTDRRKAFFSFWLKRGSITLTDTPWSGTLLYQDFTGAGYPAFRMAFEPSADGFTFRQYTSASTFDFNLVTTRQFRDILGHVHFFVVYDSTQAIAADRIKIWVNGVLETSFSSATYPALNTNIEFGNNTTMPSYIGGPNRFFDGLLSHFIFGDGQTPAVTSCGQIDGVSGQWAHRRYTGAYGANGCLLEFQDASAATAAAIGKDTSGNGKNWTPSGISVAAGPTFDQSLDTPTNNHSAANRLSSPGTARGTSTISNANTTVTHTDGFYYSMRLLDQPVQSFPVYVEATIAAVGSVVGPCIIAESVVSSFDGNNGPGGTGLSSLGWYRRNDGMRRNNGSDTTGLSTFTTNDTVMIALDPVNGRGWFGKVGTGWDASGNPATGANPNFTFTPGTKFFLGSDGYNGASVHWNTGQRPFAATPPFGFFALNTQNLPTPGVINPADAYLETIYAGNNSTQAIPARFSAGSIRQKAITVARSWRATNSVRGFNLVTNTDTTAIEIAGSSIASVSPTAINLQNADNYNTTGENYILQAWRIGALYGFNVVVYTGNGSTQNIAHGLGAVPHYIEVKKISGAAQRWCVFHRGWGAARYGYLNEINAFDTANAALRWGNNTVTVEPTSSVFTVGNSDDVNSNTNLYVAFVYTSIPGLSAFPSYIGNSSASAGPWCDLGFKFRTLTIKDGSAASGHRQYSGTRQPFNGALQSLLPNSSALPSTENFIDRYASGFRLITGAGNGVNDSGNRYLVTAFAEAPFKYATAV